MIVHFYGSGRQCPWWRRQVARAWVASTCLIMIPLLWRFGSWRARLLAWNRIAMEQYGGGLHHVEVEIGGESWLWAAAHGAVITGRRAHYPSKRVSVPARVGCPSRTAWMRHGPCRPILCAMYAAGMLPRLRGVETCSTMVSRMLGYPLHRNPGSLLRAMREGSEIAR